jgi:hypothetical protein
LGQLRLTTRDFAADLADTVRLLQAGCGLLETEVEQLLPKLGAFGREFRCRQIFKIAFRHDLPLNPSCDVK